MHAIARAVMLVTVPFALGALVADYHDAGSGKVAVSDATSSVLGRGYSIVNVAPTTVTQVTTVTLPSTNTSIITSSNGTASYQNLPSMTSLNAILGNTTTVVYSLNTSSTATASLTTLTDPINPKVTVVRNMTSMTPVNNTSVDTGSYLNIYTWVNSNGVSSTSMSSSHSSSISAITMTTTSVQVVGLATTSPISGSDIRGTTASTTTNTGQVQPTPSSDASKMLDAPSLKYHIVAAGMSMGICLGLALLL